MTEDIPGLPKRRSGEWVIALPIVAVALFAIYFYVTRNENPSASATLPAAGITDSQPTDAQQILRFSDAASAVAFLRPRLGSAVGQTPSEGAELLAAWAARKLTWDQLAALKATSYARAMKDPDAETGNYICATALIVQIRADRSLGAKVFRALMSLDYGQNLSVVAVGSSGDLVEKRTAHFCGIVTGTWEFPNISGGFTPSVHLVGMFDLPENRPALAKPARRP